MSSLGGGVPGFLPDRGVRAAPWEPTPALSGAGAAAGPSLASLGLLLKETAPCSRNRGGSAARIAP